MHNDHNRCVEVMMMTIVKMTSQTVASLKQSGKPYSKHQYDQHNIYACISENCRLRQCAVISFSLRYLMKNTVRFDL